MEKISKPKPESQSDRDFFAFPIPKTDDRIIVWESKRKDIQGPACSCCSFDDIQTKRFPNFEYLLLPEDLKEEYNKLSPDQHHQIERSLCFRNGSVVEYNPILFCNSRLQYQLQLSRERFSSSLRLLLCHQIHSEKLCGTHQHLTSCV